MNRIGFADKLVVVTGASSGLGREIARSLAYREGAHLVIAARRRERLEELRAEIEAGSASRVRVCAVDLAAPDGPATLFRAATAAGDVAALVNCAGITYFGRTLDAPPDTYEQMIALNLLGQMKTSMLFLRHFLSRNAGAILTVTSFMAFVPAPFQNCYAATKHGLQAFMEGCAAEYRGKGITFSTFAPGGMATEMLSLAGTDAKFARDNPVNMDPARAAVLAIRGFKKGRVVSVPGLLYKTARLLVRIAPRSVVAPFVYRLFGP